MKITVFRAALLYTIFVFVTLFYMMDANADEINISTHSYHLVYKPCMDKYRPNKECKYEEYNPGVGYEHSLKGRTSSTIGFYRNSYGKVSFYTGFSYRWRYVAIQGGLVTGYPQYPVVPVVTPSFSVPITDNVIVEILTPLYIGRMQIVGMRVRYVL